MRSCHRPRVLLQTRVHYLFTSRNQLCRPVWGAFLHGRWVVRRCERPVRVSRSPHQQWAPVSGGQRNASGLSFRGRFLPSGTAAVERDGPLDWPDWKTCGPPHGARPEGVVPWAPRGRPLTQASGLRGQIRRSQGRRQTPTLSGPARGLGPWTGPPLPRRHGRPGRPLASVQ